MSSSQRLVALLFALLAIHQLGCGKTTSTDRLATCFEEMKSATIAFHENLVGITDVSSAESLLPELEASHERLAIAVQALDEAGLTSSRQARLVKRDIEDFKTDSKGMIKKELDRLKSDEILKTALEPFLVRINAIQSDMGRDQRPPM